MYSQIFHIAASEGIIKNHYHQTPNQTTSAQDKKRFLTLRIPPQVVHVCSLAPGGKPLPSAHQQQLGVDDQRITNQ